MSIQDATIRALSLARTEQQALDLLIEARPMNVYEARLELGRAVVAVGWAMLVAPELWVALSAWWRVQRFADDLRKLRRTRGRLLRGLAEPEIMTVIEMSKEDGPPRFADGVLVREVKVGNDLLSRRSEAHFKGEDSITRKEEAMARAEVAFQRAADRYRASLDDIATLTPQAIAARLLARSWRTEDLATCRALLEVATAPQDAAGLLSDEDRRARIDELLAKRAGRV